MVGVDGGSLPSWLAWFEGLRPSGTQLEFIEWTASTPAMASPWWQRHKHCRWF